MLAQPLVLADRTNEFSLVVPITPKGQGRPRFSADGSAPYTPPSTRKYTDAIRAAAIVHWGDREPLVGAIALHVRLFFPLPKQSKGRTFHLQRPDGSNCYKAVEDALLPHRKKKKGVWVTEWAGVYRDDCIIVDGRFYKEWAPPGEPGSVALKIWSLA